jgi:porin
LALLTLGLTLGLLADDNAPAAAADQASASAATPPAATAPAASNSTAIPAASSNTTSSTATASSITTAAPAAPATTFWTQPTLTGNWGGLRDTLGNDGFAPFASWSGEIWGNANGGIQTGMTQDMLLSTGFDLDLQKLVSWQGASFHAELHWEQGQNPVTNTGSFTNPSSIVSSNTVRIYSLYFKQVLFDSQLSLKGGQFGVDQDFFQTNSAGLFLNTGYTTPTSLFGQVLADGHTAIAQYPVVAPAIWARYDSKPLPIYLQAGIYDGDPGPDAANNHGFDWQTGPGAGALFIGEAGWNYTLANLGGTLKAGTFYHTGHFTNWNSGTSASDIYGAYAMVDQTLFQTPAPDPNSSPNPILTAYAFAGWAGPDNLVGPNNTYSVGLNWHGPIPGRDNDVVGLAVEYTGFSPTYTASAFNPNGAGKTTAAETDVELTYQLVLTPWFNLQPDAQLIFNPANSGTRATAAVFGTRAVVTF